MAKKRAKFFETRTFGFVIAAAVIAVILALSYGTGLLQSIELKANDANFRLKLAQKGKTVQEGSVYSEKARANFRRHHDRGHRLQLAHEVRPLALPAHAGTPTSSTPSPASRTRAPARTPCSWISFLPTRTRIRPTIKCYRLRSRSPAGSSSRRN